MEPSEIVYHQVSSGPVITKMKQFQDTYFEAPVTCDSQQLKVFGVKSSLREIKWIFPIKILNFKFLKMLKLLNFRFPG